MNKEEQNKLVPMWRFPEFEDADGWEISEVGERFQITRGNVLSMTLVSEAASGEKIFPVYSSQTKNKGLAGYYNEWLFEDAITWTTDGANAGDVNYRNGKFYCTNVCGVLLNKNGFANGCISELINSVSRSYVSYVGNPKLMNGVMSKIKIPFPSLAEQQKIADCLSSLDELITAHSSQLEALKAHKKGLLQQLFPAAGETVPRLRFPEFRDSGEWEEKKLGAVLRKHPEYGLNAAAVAYSDDLPTYLRITDISEEGVFLKENKVSVGQAVTAENYLNEGDIVLARTGASVGKSYKYKPEDGRLVFAGFLIRVQPNESELNSELLYQFLSTDTYWKWVAFTSQRSGQPGINGNEYASLEIPLPPSIAEQRKIASCLSSIDERITAQTEKIAQLKLHKKGLMQGLFLNTLTS